jgi:hypothetical protein
LELTRRPAEGMRELASVWHPMRLCQKRGYYLKCLPECIAQPGCHQLDPSFAVTFLMWVAYAAKGNSRIPSRIPERIGATHGSICIQEGQPLRTRKAYFAPAEPSVCRFLGAIPLEYDQRFLFLLEVTAAAVEYDRTGPEHDGSLDDSTVRNARRHRIIVVLVPVGRLQSQAMLLRRRSD